MVGHLQHGAAYVIAFVAQGFQPGALSIPRQQEGGFSIGEPGDDGKLVVVFLLRIIGDGGDPEGKTAPAKFQPHIRLQAHDGYVKLLERGVIEIAPLAYMRGRTLSNAFIILDEAQNTTREQMKMFLTRMGFGSKVVVTGDVTQIDLPRGKKSGLVEALRVLKNIRDIDICYLKDTDVVRHELVKKIINAYDQFHRKYPEEMQE